MPRHQAARQVQPHPLEPHYQHQRISRARLSAAAATTFLATEMAAYLPSVPIAANPYRALRGTRAKREAILQETFLPQALFDLLAYHGEAGRIAARALLGVDTEGDGGDGGADPAAFGATYLIGLSEG